ncbi:MAG: GNAT family N-acetyltransferase [Erysipelotrichales bacterium]
MIKIRNGKVEDLEELFIIENNCFPPSEAASREAMKQRLEIINDSFFVALENNKLVGLVNGPVINVPFISDDLFDEIIENPKTGGYQSILGLAVDPSVQRRGIAGQLLRHLEQEAIKAGRDGLSLTCKEKLIPYYESFGYKNEGVSESVHGGVTWYNMVNYLK